MKGKIAFVLGAAVGYVLGTRAGRARYEQIKSGTKVIWNSAPVQQGVGAVQGVVGDGVSALKSAALQAGQDAFASFIRPATQPTQAAEPAATHPAASSASAPGAGAKGRPTSATAQSAADGVSL